MTLITRQQQLEKEGIQREDVAINKYHVIEDFYTVILRSAVSADTAIMT
jgi:hypothetical protein